MRSGRPFQTKWIVLFVIVVSVGVALPAIAHRGYSEGSLAGRWAFVEEFHDGGVYGTTVGTYVFDRAGSCTYSGTTVGGANANPTPIEGSCTFSLSPGGGGVVEGEEMVDIDFVLGAHGRLIRYIHMEDPGYFGHGQMRPQGSVDSTSELTGRFIFVEDFRVGGEPGSTAGIARFDGSGGCSERWSEHGGLNSAGPKRVPWVECTYSVDRLGQGVIKAGFTELVDQHFVVAEDGQTTFFIDADEEWPTTRGIGQMSRS